MRELSVRGDAGFAVRLRFSKRGKVRFVGHRDLARSFERAFRVAELPLAFSQGFSPRPKVSLGLALGVGHESEAEYLDLELVQPVDLEGLPAALAEALPQGVVVDGAVQLAARAPALQESITCVEYDLVPAHLSGAQLADAVEHALARSELTVETTRKGLQVVEDLRPGIRRLAAHADGSVHAEVATKPRGIRPADLLSALRSLSGATRAPSDLGEDRVVRTHQWIERDGARHEPLAADRVPCSSDDAHDISKGLMNVERRNDRHTEQGRRGPEPAALAGTARIA